MKIELKYLWAKSRLSDTFVSEILIK